MRADRLVAIASSYRNLVEYDEVDISEELAKIALVSDSESDDSHEISEINSTNKASFLTKEVLARRWGIGLEAADPTLRVMTQNGI